MKTTFRIGDIVTFTNEEGKTVTEVVTHVRTRAGIIEGKTYDLSYVKNLRKIGQVFFSLLFVVFLNSCTTTKGSAYQNHLKSKRTGAHQLHNGNGGCNWNK
jgi:hypothetical protein